MPKNDSVRIPLGYERLIRERDEILSKLATIPTARKHSQAQQHLSIAVFEAWADGVLDDDRLNEELSKYHADVKECSRCSENFEFYKKRRDRFCRTIATM